MPLQILYRPERARSYQLSRITTEPLEDTPQFAGLRNDTTTRSLRIASEIGIIKPADAGSDRDDR